jgi:nitrogen fixation protein NifB
MKIDTPGLGTYPCFSRKGLAERSLLLHVTTVCNTRCRHCVRAEGPAGGEQRMGIGTTAMDADAAVQLVDRGLKRPEPPVVVEIGGPGEPLLNRSTYAVLRRLRAEYPGLELSVWTNGILLAERLEDLMRSGAKRITLSLNAATHDTAERIYERIIFRGKNYAGAEAARLLLQQQWTGLEQAVETGFGVSVCITLIPGVNEREIDRISSIAGKIGADRIIVAPLEIGS